MRSDQCQRTQHSVIRKVPREAPKEKLRPYVNLHRSGALDVNVSTPSVRVISGCANHTDVAIQRANLSAHVNLIEVVSHQCSEQTRYKVIAATTSGVDLAIVGVTEIAGEAQGSATDGGDGSALGLLGIGEIGSSHDNGVINAPVNIVANVDRCRASVGVVIAEGSRR